MFEEFNQRGEAYSIWLYRKANNPKGMEGKIFLSTQVKQKQHDGWYLIDDLRELQKIDSGETKPVKGADKPPLSKKDIMEALLRGEGLNITSYMRKQSQVISNSPLRKKAKAEIEHYLGMNEGKVYKQNKDWFYNEVK